MLAEDETATTIHVRRDQHGAWHLAMHGINMWHSPPLLLPPAMPIDTQTYLPVGTNVSLEVRATDSLGTSAAARR